MELIIVEQQKQVVKSFFPRVIVGGIEVDVCSEIELTKLICDQAIIDRSGDKHCRLVFDANGHGIALAAFDQSYREALQQAEIIHADGQALIWASQIFCDQKITERSATTDLIHSVGRGASDSEIKIFFLGAKPAVISSAADRFRSLYPKAKLVGFRDGYFTGDQVSEVISQINATQADILFIGLGKPREQLFSQQIKNQLQVSWVITAGGCFDFLAGNAPRAPGWMQSLGLEWLYRLLQDPKRLFWRYLWTNTVAIFLLIFKSGNKVNNK
ncbi:WecB/TagA/CpsF family glycosyltransferase [Methylophilus methylotrophus]|uniref:WecB/TagA/CpsF family glycosyltransferase n=1 Tax=Methylophilus methylotrophus TaxID=17 RepID=UPI00036E35B5|nr:WecB/TagA/CpsF family glycosyltransferase [Methylophilus methylotrophus]